MNQEQTAERFLTGKVALVTASGRNIGRATVLELARRGADVVVNARTNKGEAETVAAEARKRGVKALPVLADVGSEAQLDSMMKRVFDEYGRVDILINMAGLRQATPIVAMTNQQWREVLAVNLDAPFYLCRAVAPGMIERGWGRIINVSGLNAFKGRPGWAHVSSGKMGALGLTRALSAELSPHGILVNHIVPGAFDTDRDGTQSLPPSPERAAGIPLARLGMPEEIAATCAFLASDGATFITGQTIHVNGGSYAY
jgi:3-oxoacyl-[acyl-carrier protein] reductase